MDLLNLVRRIPFAPPIFNEKTLNTFGAAIELPQTTFPNPTFTGKCAKGHGRVVPQAIAHRGHKVDFPENSLQAFETAITVGAEAIETDIHLSKDKVVVLSHDADLKRCFGIEGRIGDCNWDYLRTISTTRQPSQPMACLEDLLRLLARESHRHIWLLLDIKFDDDPEELMFYAAEAFHKIVPVGTSSPWKNRVLLGFWTATFVPLCHKYFQDFPIVNIGFSVPYSRQFLQIPGSGFNMLQASAVFPAGRSFINEAQKQGRRTYAWTVNDEESMNHCIRWGFDGVITDDVTKFIQVCEAFDAERKKPSWPLKLLLGFAYFNLWVFIFGVVFRRRYGTCILASRLENYKTK